jgi:hypothetical protein
MKKNKHNSCDGACGSTKEDDSTQHRCIFATQPHICIRITRASSHGLWQRTVWHGVQVEVGLLALTSELAGHELRVRSMQNIVQPQYTHGSEAPSSSNDRFHWFRTGLAQTGICACGRRRVCPPRSHTSWVSLRKHLKTVDRFQRCGRWFAWRRTGHPRRNHGADDFRLSPSFNFDLEIYRSGRSFLPIWGGICDVWLKDVLLIL